MRDNLATFPATTPKETAAAARPSSMSEIVVQSIRATVVTLVLTGLVYPLAVTGIAKVLFPHRAEGSLVTDESGRVVGSELLAQPFSGAGYFQPRPSAAGDKGYDPMGSGGSNLGPTSQKLHDGAAATLDKLQKENPDAAGLPPVELVTASGSGLDPHLSPEAALWQAPRIAKARGVSVERVRQVVDDLAEGRELGFLGERRVNVLMLNLSLDRRFGAPHG